MKKISIHLFFLSFLSPRLPAQAPDWSTKIATIIYNNCSTCHHDGGIAPFSLMSYEDAANNAFAIQADVNASIMPPWPPDPSFTHFRDEKVLSSDEISSINKWVDGGMPAGNLSLAPQPPVFNGNSLMQEIDDTFQFPAYEVEKTNDEYRTFVIHSGYTETKFLNEVEFVPSDLSMVHHVFLFQDTSDLSYQEDLETPEPGFPGGGLGGFSKYAVLLCGWIPGNDIIRLPANMGFEIPAGADLIIAVHYAPGTKGKTDSTKINVRFSDAPNVRSVENQRLLFWKEPSLINPPFIIPANEVVTFYEKSPYFDIDQSLIAIQPHCHLIGKSWKVYMVTPPGDTTNLLYIPDWSFHWQLNYFFTKVIKIPAGAQIFGEAVFDNTIYNPNNPSNPPVEVHAGESTFSEMMGCRFSLLDYEPGDENIILDSSFYTSSFTESVIGELQTVVFPNPAANSLHFIANIPEHEVFWTVTDHAGKAIRAVHKKNIPNRIYSQEIDFEDIAPGVYLLIISSGTERSVKKVVVVK